MSVGRDKAASAAQYVLLGGFASVASGISSQGLTGFARANMALPGPWPYLLFFALDGAAGVCAVLLARRAARAGGGTAPRLAVWGLVTASATFNYTHAPRRPEAPEAYALMPVIAAVLFEFCLQEARSRTAGRLGRGLGALRWLRPAEGVRVRLRMAADDTLSAVEATRVVRIESAARSLYRLREALAAQGRADAPSSPRARRALRRAHAALARAGFADAAVAAEVLRHVQVLTMTAALAALDYASADAAQTAIASLITPAASGPAQPELPAPLTGPPEDGTPHAVHSKDEAGAGPCLVTATVPPFAPDAAPAADDPANTTGAGAGAVSPAETLDDRDSRLVEAARRIAEGAAREGTRLSQAALAERLRGQGWTIANDRLSWLAATVGLGPRRG